MKHNIFTTSTTLIERRRAIAGPLTIASIYCIALAFAAPFSSSVYTELVYNYEAVIANGQNGFRFTAKAHLELLYATTNTAGQSLAGFEQQPSSGQLVRLRLSQPVFYPGPSSEHKVKPLRLDNQNLHNPEYDLYAHIITHPNGTAYIKSLYTHQADAATFKNIKKSILINLLPTNHHLRPLSNTDQPVLFRDDNDLSQPELFSPDSISQVSIVAKARKSSETTTTSNSLDTFTGQTVFQSVEGHQNVTFGSRVFSQAQSNLTTSFQLHLLDELKSTGHEKFDQATSIDGAIKLLDKKKYQADTIELERERRICSVHHCKRSLSQLCQDYEESLEDKSMASVEMSVAVLRIMDKLRDSKGTSVGDILAVLESMNESKASFMDILAVARTQNCILAALKHLKLAKNRDLDLAERFLSVLSVAAKTHSKMQQGRQLRSPYYFTPSPALKRSKSAREQHSAMASLEFIANEFLNVLKQTPAKKWASQKLRWSTLLTLATLVEANNQDSHYENLSSELNSKVSSLLLKELTACGEDDAECRVVVIQALGNVGRLEEEEFQVLKEHILHSSWRESVTAMKVLRDSLQYRPKDRPMSPEFYVQLKELLLRVVYDDSLESTCRVLATELIVRFLPDSLAPEQLIYHLPSFNNNELATMIYSRIHSLRPQKEPKHHDWYWKSCIINGTSASFVNTLAKTDSLTASYGVSLELFRGKFLRESSFDVLLDTKKRTQPLFSLGISARGLQNIPGVPRPNDMSEVEENEPTMSGMSIRLLGGYLRPLILFRNWKEIASYLIFARSETAFIGNLMLIDHQEGYPLISGFVAEQQMRGVLSIDVSGSTSTSIWRFISHNTISTKASVIVQASQSVFTSYDNLWNSHLFSFGGQASIDFITDADFSSDPQKFCLQVTQPEFVIRYNSRRHDQLMTEEVRRKITRRTFSISAKSYPLNTENNKMCSLYFEEEL